MTPIRGLVALLLLLAPAATYSTQVLHRINHVRAAHGHPYPFRDSLHLDRDAARRAALASTETRAWFNVHIHDRLVARQVAVGVLAPNKGEVAAYGYTTPRALVSAYMHSPEHRAILLTSHRTYQVFGCGESGTNNVCDFAGR